MFRKFWSIEKWLVERCILFLFTFYFWKWLISFFIIIIIILGGLHMYEDLKIHRSVKAIHTG